jgi:GntP family gluconate:H+ symporter
MEEKLPWGRPSGGVVRFRTASQSQGSFMTSLDIQLLLTALVSVLVLVASSSRASSCTRCWPCSWSPSAWASPPAWRPPDRQAARQWRGQDAGRRGRGDRAGAMLGKILADAGITEQIAAAILKHASTA